MPGDILDYENVTIIGPGLEQQDQIVVTRAGVLCSKNNTKFW